MDVSPQRSSTDSECRRSSGKFANLQAAMRDPTNDRAAARRASMIEHGQQPGFFGSLWNSAIRGRDAGNK